MLAPATGLARGAASGQAPADRKQQSEKQRAFHFLVPDQRHLHMAVQGQDVGGAIGMELIGAQGAHAAPAPSPRLWPCTILC